MAFSHASTPSHEEVLRVGDLSRAHPSTTERPPAGGVRWVLVADRPRGVSTFDKPGVPSGRGWEYFCIPKGTELPDGLAIVRDEFNDRFGATHHTIAPARDMPLETFKQLLEKLARSLVREAM